jgi:hypothetical protein
MIDRDAQQAAGRPLDFDQLVAQSGTVCSTMLL